MKILILFIYSESNIYNKMMNLQKKYIHKFNEVDSYFVQMRESQLSEIEIENDIIFVKGKETYMNILYKTIKSIEYLFKKEEYDFVIRTNISTIINIPKLINYLTYLNPKEHLYTGGSFFGNLQWIDKRGGITDKTFWGTKFMGGRSITFSAETIKDILNNINNLRYDIVDDVSFGIYINKYLPIALQNGEKKLSKTYHTKIENKEQLINSYMNYEFYRNMHGSDRNNDLILMDLLINLLYIN